MNYQQSVFQKSEEYQTEIGTAINFLEFDSSKINYKLLEQVDLQQMNTNVPNMIKIKKNPYNSNWATKVLNKHYHVDIQCQGNNLVVKKLSVDSGTSTLVSPTNSLPKIQSPIDNQGKLFSNPALSNSKEILNKQRRYVTQISAQSRINTTQQNVVRNNINENQKSNYAKNHSKLMPIFDINASRFLIQYNI